MRTWCRRRRENDKSDAGRTGNDNTMLKAPGKVSERPGARFRWRWPVDAHMAGVDAHMAGVDAHMAGVDAHMAGVDAHMA
eukprot:gene16961-biopygen17298